MSAIIDSVLGALVLSGALLLCAASLGLLRGSDAFARIQSVAKAGSVGVVLLLLSVAIAGGNFAIFMRALAAAVLILVNTLLMAQMLAESADREEAPEQQPGSSQQ